MNAFLFRTMVHMSNFTLKDIPIFNFLEPADIERFTPFTRIIQKVKDEVIILAGENVIGVYIVLNGEVSVVLNNKAVGYLAIGEAFGEMALVEDTLASATVKAETDLVKLMFIHKRVVKELLDIEPRIGSAFFRGIAVVLSKKLRNTTREFISP